MMNFLELEKEVDKYLTEGDLRREVNLNIKTKMEINSYQGTRHKKNLPVRGQRTSRNAKTRKGKGKVVANKKKIIRRKIWENIIQEKRKTKKEYSCWYSSYSFNIQQHNRNYY